MKAITLWQPWATLIAIGAKTIETRSWPAPKSLIGQRIAIHAAVRQPVSLYDADVISDHRTDGSWWLRTLTADHPMPLGAVVNTARLAACLPMIDEGGHGCGPQDPFALVINHNGTRARIYNELGNVAGIDVTDQLPYGHFERGRWAWVFDDIEALPEPVPATGRQGIWEWTP